MIASAASVIENPTVYVPAGSSVSAADLGVSKVVPREGIVSGIILENADGTLQIDMQYRTILQTIWDRELKSLSDILFG